jgi:Domain of unknown function (DUF4440)
MKSTISRVAASTLAICMGLLMAQPRHRASANETAMDTRSQSATDPMEQQIVSKEREELDSLKAGNLEVFANLLADDAVFVDAEGPASKEEIVKNVAGFRLLEYSMEGVKFVPISAKSGLITYSITERGVSHGKEFAAHIYVSALWLQRGSQWVCVFSQETVAKPAKGK